MKIAGNWDRGVVQSYTFSWDISAVRALSGLPPHEPGNYHPKRLLWMCYAEAVALMALLVASALPFLAAALMKRDEWCKAGKNNLVMTLDGMVFCVENFISAVATSPELRQNTWIMSRAPFNQPQFAQFEQLMAGYIAADESSARHSAHAHINEFCGTSTASAGGSGKSAAALAGALHRMVDAFEPQGGRIEKAQNQPSSTSSTSASSSTSNSVESSASSVADVRPSIYRSLGIPAANEWHPPTSGQAPDWATRISVDVLLKNVCSVKELYDVFQLVLQPLDAKYGSTASGISQGCSWRSQKNQPKATLAMWAHGPLFEEFAKTECDIDALQRRIDM